MVTAQPERVGSARPADSTGVGGVGGGGGGGGTPGLRAQYRDYLKNRFIDVAHNSGYQAATPLMLEDALQRRFHQVFSIVDESPQPVLPLLISVVFDALVGPVAQGGFGLDGGQIPPQGKVSDADYFAQLIGMTKVNTSELLNRYRVEFDRSPGELSSPVDLNIEALQGLLTDSFESPVESVGVVDVPPEPQFKPIVPSMDLGHAPFFLEYEEWLAQQQTFYAENLYDIHHAVPVLDADYRSVVDSYPELLPSFGGGGYLASDADIKASKTWLHSLYDIFDTFDQVFPALDAQQYPQANDLLNKITDQLRTAIENYERNDNWFRARFDFEVDLNDAQGNIEVVAPNPLEQLISLEDRARRPVGSLVELVAFEGYFAAPPLIAYSSGESQNSTAAREMYFVRSRSLFIYDLFLLSYVAVPFLRARIAAEQGAYADALALLAPLTGLLVRVAELDGTDPGRSLPYTVQVGFNAAGSGYKDPNEPIFTFDPNLTSFPLAPFERTYFKLQQGEIMLAWADRLHRAAGGNVRRARELYKGVLFLHDVDPDIAPHFTPVLNPPIGFGGVNPHISSQISRAQLGLNKIARGLNAYGYSDDFVPVLRYKPLKDAADRFAAAAKSAENEFIAYIGRLEQAEIDEAQAQSLVAKADASVRIAQDEQANAQFEVDRANDQLAAVQAAIAAKEQEIADSGSLFNQAFSFLRDGVAESMQDVMDSAGKVLKSSGPPYLPKDDADYQNLMSGVLDGSDLRLGKLHSNFEDQAAGFEFAESLVAFEVIGVTALASIADEENRRDAELAHLQQVDLPLAQSVVALKQRNKDIADLELQIADSEQNFAHWLLTFQRQRFESRAFWQTLANLTGRLMSRYIELGARTAWFAERALAFEQRRTLHIVRLDYQAPQLRDITGADLLQSDLAELEAARLDGVRSTTAVARSVSLARDFPLAFATLKTTGSCTFRTAEALLRRAYPGTYGYRIRNVTPIVQTMQALPTRGLLINGGLSMVSDETGALQPLARFPDALPLSDFVVGVNSTVFGVPSDTLLQFEGSGFDTTWQLTCPPGANPQGLSALADVVLRFDLYAYWSPLTNGTTTGAASPAPPQGVSILLSAGAFDGAAMRVLRAGDATSATVTFDLKSLRLPQPGPMAIANMGVIAAGLPPLATPVSASIDIGGAKISAPLSDRVALTNAGPLANAQLPHPWNALVAQTADQALRVTLAMSDGSPLPRLRDLVLFLELQPPDQKPPLASRWTQLFPESSTSQPEFDRAGHSAVLDPSSGRMIVFGGAKFEEASFMSDLEALVNSNGVNDDGTWITLIQPNAPQSPLHRAQHSAVYDAPNNRMIVFGGTTDIYAYENDVWVLSNASGVGGASTWQLLSPQGGPPPARAGHAAVYDAPNNRMIVFGGATYTAVFSDVWVLSNANGMAGNPVWTALAPSGSIPGLASPAAAYDASSNTLFVFGGYLSTTTLEVTNGVWALSNANGLGGVPAWKQLQVDVSSAGAPAPRLGHSMLYDQATGHIVVFGGTESTGTTMFNDVWLLVNPGSSLPRWSRLPAIGEPPAPRVYHTAVLDPASRRMTVYAGGSKEGNFFSVWVLELAPAS